MRGEMEWSHDFCLACDRQTMDGESYCSQACRLADMERACRLSLSSSSNSNMSTSTRPASYRTTINSGAGSGFHLPPAINFAAYKSSEQSGSQSSSASLQHRSGHGSVGSTGAAQASAAGSSNSDQRLTPSSSGTSLSSMSSMARDSVSSEELRNELIAYYAAFDQTRDWKRRRTFA